MVFDGWIEGRYVKLHSAEKEDALFTKTIREHPNFVNCFPPLEVSLTQQVDWLEKQQKEEGDYFFVVWDMLGKRIGTIGIYHIRDNKGESGRLAILGNALQALEAQLLSFRFAFDTLNLECLDGYIFADNKKAIRFNRQFGGRHYETGEIKYGHRITRIENWKEDFEKADKQCSALLYRDR